MPENKDDQAIKSTRGKSSFGTESFGEYSPSTAHYSSDFGSSQYDDSRLNPEYIMKGDFQKQRGEAQPWYDKAGNGLINMSGRFLTAGAEGILNPLVGSIYAIKDGKVASFYDNPFTRTLDEADKQIKSMVPFYSTKREDEAHGFEKLLYGNTLWRDVLDGVGYSGAAMLSGSVYTKAFTALGKTAMVGKSAEFIEGLRKIENSADKLKFIETANKINSFKDGMSNGIIAGLGAMSESSANARSDKNEFKSSMSAEIVKSQGFPLTDSQKEYIEMLSEEAGNSSFALNMPIIMLDNWITFGKNMFGNKATDALNFKAIGQGVEKEGFDEAYKLAKKTAIDKAVSKTYGIRKFATPIVTEGFFQEQSQYGITKGVNDYYKKRFYNADADDFISSLGKGVYEAYGTKEGWDQGIIGALSGGLTGNITKLATEGAAGYVDPNVAKAVPEALSNLSTKKTYQDLIAKAMAHANLTDDQKRALDANDTFNYENSKNDAFINYVSTKVKYGKSEDLQKELEQLKSMTAEEFKENFGTDMTIDQLSQTKESVAEFVESKIKKVKNVQRAYDIINERFPNASDGNKERLAYASLTIDNAKDRKVSLNKDVNKILMDSGNYAGTGVNPLILAGNDYLSLSKELKAEWIDQLSKASMEDSKKETAISKIKDIDKLEERELQFMKEYNELKKEHVQAANDLLDAKAKEAVAKAKDEPIVVPPAPFGQVTPEEKAQADAQAEAEAKAKEAERVAAEEAKRAQAQTQTYDQAEADEWIKYMQDAAPGQLDSLINKAEETFYNKYQIGVPKDIHDAYIESKEKHAKVAQYKGDLSDILRSTSSAELVSKASAYKIKSNPLYIQDTDAQQKISALHSELVAKEKEAAIADAKAAAEKAEQDKLNSNPPIVLNEGEDPEKAQSLKPAVLSKDVFNRLDGPNVKLKEFQNILLGLDLKSKGVMKAIKLKLFRDEREFKGNKITHTIQVLYNDLNLGYLASPNAFPDSWIEKETDNKQYIEEQRDLSAKFWNYITNNGKLDNFEISLDKLVDENILSIGTTGGTLEFMHAIGGRKTIEEANQEIELVKHDGKTVIIDTQKGALGKMFSLVGQDASFEDVFDAYPSENYGDRYLVAIKDSDGKTRFVPCQPAMVDEAIMNQTIADMKVQSEKAFKKNDAEIIDQEINDKFNSDVNSKMFITIPAESKGKAIDKIFGIEFKVMVAGGVMLDFNIFDNNSHIKIGLTNEEFSKIKDLNDLIKALNHEINYAYDMSKILSTEQKITLTPNSFRQSVDRLSIDEASKQLETSLNTAMPFTNARVKLNFNSEVLAAKAVQKNESEAATPTVATSDIESKKADIERRRQEKINRLSAEYGDVIPLNDPEFKPIHAKYDKELARELYKEMKAGKMITQMTVAEQGIVYKYVSKDLRESVDAELAALESKKAAPTVRVTDKTKSYEQLIEEAFTAGDFDEAQRLIDEQAKKGFVDPLSQRADKIVDESEAGNTINISEAKSWIEKNLPRFISVDDISKILDNININGISWGAFQNSVIYLNSKAGKGTEFHEAFHAVFRTLLSEQEIRSYLAKAKAEYKGNIKEAVEKLKKQNPEAANLSPQKLEDIVLEEYMADKFMEWKKNRSNDAGAGLKGLFAKIKDWAKFLLSNKDTLDALFNKIDRGQFKNAKAKMNRFYSSKERADKLVPAGSSKFLSSQESDKVISTVTLRLGNRLAQRLPEDAGKTKIGVLKSLIELMAKESTINSNKAIIDKLSRPEQLRFLKKLTQEAFTYTDKDSVDLIIKQVKSRLAMINASSEEESDDYESKEGEIGNRFDLNASNIGGFGNINKAVRALIGMTTINEVDEFGRNTTRAVNVSTVFNGIERVLANTPKSGMIAKLRAYSEYNPEVKVFFDKLAGLINYNEETGTYDSNNTLKAFTSAFHKFKVKYIFGAIDINSKKYKFFDANQRDVAFKQVSDWNNSFINNYSSLSNESKRAALKNLNLLNGKYLAPNKNLKKQLTEVELNTAVKEVKKALNSIGIDLSEGFISFSILNNRKLSNKQKPYIDPFGDVEPLQISGKDNDVIKTLLSTLNDNGDPYVKTVTKEGVELEDDNYSKLKKIAENNAIFDESVGSSSFQNAEGETVFDKILGSFTIRRIAELRSSDVRNVKSYKDFRKSNPEFSDYYSKGFYEFIKSNPLLNSKDAELIFDKQFAVNLIDGVAARKLSKNEETGELFINNEVSEEEGKTFKDMQIRDTLLMMYGLYEMEKEKSIKSKNGAVESFKYAQYYFKVLEASNTGYTVQLPKVKYFENGKINDAAKSALNTFFKQEFDRVARGFSEMRDIKSAKDDGRKSPIPEVEGYHTSVKGKEPRAINFWNFKFLSKELQDTLKDLANDGKSIDEETMRLVESEIETNFMKELDSHFDKMVDLKVINEVYSSEKKASVNEEGLEPSKKRYNNLMLPESYIKSSNKELSNANVANFFFNDLINVWAINQLIDGDIAYSRIDEKDYVKRNKGNNAMQQTFGEGKSRGAILEEPRLYVDKALNIVDKSHPEAQKIDVADAQMWERIEWRIHKLKELGNFSEPVEAVYKKIENDDELTDADIKTLRDNDAMLISDKDIYFDGPNYLKLSSFCITRGYCSIKVPHGTPNSHISRVNGKSYLPDPRFEFEYNLLNKMEEDGIAYVMPPSASKGATEDVAKDIDSLVAREYDNKNFGRQHAVPSNKTKITDGSQKNGLIGSENENASELAEKHDNLLAQRAKNAMYKAVNLLKNNLGDKSYTLKYVIDKFNDTLQESGADINLLEFFAKDEVTGEPKFELNMPITVIKFEQLFYAHFTKDVLYSKAPGYAAVLKSSHGVKVALDSKGNVITNADIKKGAKVSSTRELGHNIEEVDSNGKKTGRLYSEIMLPRHFAEFGLKPGDNLSEEAMVLLGFRIPTDDKHSMMTLKIVDFLPEQYGSTVIAPKEIVLLSGADYDVDKLFMRRYDHYVDDSGIVKVYGKNGNDINTKWREFLIYEFSNNKDLSKLFKSKIKKSKTGALFSESINDDITSEEVREMMFYADDKATNESLAELGLPSSKDEYNSFVRENGEFNQGVVNNQLLDTEIELYSHKDMREIANTATSLSSLEDLIKDESLPFGKSDVSFNVNSINGRLASKEDNDTGKTNIGPAAVANMIFNFLAKNKIELLRKVNFNGQVFDKFSYKNSEGVRVNKLMSTILSAMTDNAKERLASVFNLTIDTIGPALYMTSIGMPIKDSMLITHSSVIKEFSKQLALTKGAIKSGTERYASSETIINDILKDLRSKISEDDVRLINEELNESDLTSEDAIAKYKILKFFKDINKDYDSFRKLNSIIQMNKGFNPKISENETVNRSKDALGIGVTSDAEFNELDLPFDIRHLFEKNGYVQEGLKAHDEVQNKVSKNFFLSQSNLAKSIVKFVRANVKNNKINSKEVFENLNKNILTYLSTRAYENYLIKTSNKSKLNTLTVDNITGENNIVDRIAKLKDNPELKDNFFLKNVIIDRVGGKNKILFDMITGNTRMKMHSSLLDRVIDGYTELYLNEETKQDAIDIFNYFVVKDGMQFKNKSISKYLGSFMFSTISDSLKEAMDVIKGDKIDEGKFIETFGKSKVDLVEEMLSITFRYEPTSFDMVPYQDKTMGEILKKVDDDSLEFNMFAGTKYAKQSMVSAEELMDELGSADNKDAKSNKDVMSANFKAIGNSLFKTKSVNDKTYVIFPLFINIDGTIYQLKNATNDLKRLPENRRLIDLINDKGEVVATRARYEKVDTFGIKDMNPFSISLSDNLKVNELFEANKLLKEERKKASRSKEGAIPELGEDYMDSFGPSISNVSSDVADVVSDVLSNIDIKDVDMLISEVNENIGDISNYDVSMLDFENLELGDVDENKGINLPESEKSGILFKDEKTNSGALISSLYNEATWNSFSEEKKEQIKKCN